MGKGNKFALPLSGLLFLNCQCSIAELPSTLRPTSPFKSAQSGEQINVQILAGTVSVWRKSGPAANGSWQELSSAESVPLGSVFRTKEKSHVILRLPSEAIIKLFERSVLEVSSSNYIRLTDGTALIRNLTGKTMKLTTRRYSVEFSHGTIRTTLNYDGRDFIQNLSARNLKVIETKTGKEVLEHSAPTVQLEMSILPQKSSIVAEQAVLVSSKIPFHRRDLKKAANSNLCVTQVPDKTVPMIPGRQLENKHLADSNGVPIPIRTQASLSSILLPYISIVPSSCNVDLGGDIFSSEGIIDVDLNPYMADSKRRVKRAWFPSHSKQSLKTILYLQVSTKGEVLVQGFDSSGNNHFDQSAIAAAINASPLRPLPAGCPAVVNFKLEFSKEVE